MFWKMGSQGRGDCGDPGAGEWGSRIEGMAGNFVSGWRDTDAGATKNTGTGQESDMGYVRAMRTRTDFRKSEGAGEVERGERARYTPTLTPPRAPVCTFCDRLDVRRRWPKGRGRLGRRRPPGVMDGLTWRIDCSTTAALAICHEALPPLLTCWHWLIRRGHRCGCPGLAAPCSLREGRARVNSISVCILS